MIFLLKKHKHLFFLALFVFFNLFFVNKAFHIDDPFTINIAEAVKENFLLPTQVFHSNPILVGYYYAPVIKLLGEKEIWLHIFSLPFSLLAMSAMFLLTRRFAKGSILPVLSLVVSPAFLITSHSIMLDMPLLAFFLSALAAFIYGIDKNNNRLLFISAVFASAAILTKYSGILIIPLVWLYAFLFSKKRVFAFLLIPIAVFFAWIIHNSIFYKEPIFLTTVVEKIWLLSAQTLLSRFLACLSFLCGTSIISIFLLPFLLRVKRNVFVFFMSIPAGTLPFFLRDQFGTYGIIEKVLLAILFISSFFFITLLTLRGGSLYSFGLQGKEGDKDRLFLSLWFVIMLIFTILTQFVAARFILLLFPPLFLFIYNDLLSNEDRAFFLFKRIMLVALLLTFLISTVLAAGDYCFAGIYRDFIESIDENIPQKAKIYFCPSSYRIYFSWGYAYYLRKYYNAQKSGRILENFQKTESLFFVTPSESALPMAVSNDCVENYRYLGFNENLAKTIEYKNNISLHNRQHHTGFYSHDWGLLPFKIFLKEQVIERFRIHRLSLSQSSILNEAPRYSRLPLR